MANSGKSVGLRLVSLLDVMAGRVQMIFDGGVSALPRVNEGKLRVLAMTVGSTPEEFSKLIGDEFPKWTQIVRRAGIFPN